MVRTAGEPTGVLVAIRERIAAFDPDLPILVLAELTDLIRASLAQQRYRAGLMTVFAVSAGLLAMLGIYTVVARTVVARSVARVFDRLISAAGGGLS